MERPYSMDLRERLILAVERDGLSRSEAAQRFGELQLSSGMAITAEIRTAERRIIQYLLSPISARLDEAGRER